jgi:hypothetical protein
MSNGYILAVEADLSVAYEVAEGFGLDVVGARSVGNRGATMSDLANADNVGVILSATAAQDDVFVSIMRSLATTRRSAQLILATPEVRAAFAFLPDAWPSMSLDDARSRAAELARRRNETATGGGPTHAQPLPPADEQPAPVEPPAPPEETRSEEAEVDVDATPDLDDALSDEREPESFGAEHEEEDAVEDDAPPAGAAEPPPPPVAAGPPPITEAEPTPAPPIRERRPEAPPERAAPAPAPAPQSVEPPRQRAGAARGETAPADATAFAPKRLRRGSPELVRIVIHQPKDLLAVIKAARQIDPRTDPAPSGMKVGDVAMGASVGVSLEVRGAACDGAVQRRVWQGEPLDFNFSAEADGDVKQVVFLARVFVDDAQIGVLAFTRPVGGANKKPHDADRVRLKRHKRVFLSYSSKDRETVAAIATAYEAAGVEHFFDRTSLKSGEEWSPRLRREIERADLFHLCWSKSAAASQWVEKEAEHALTRRRRAKKPEITVQMLDGPPWAPHPPHLDSINFDDFVRAAIVGYARGDGES